MFKVGDKVVCIDDSNQREVVIKKGNIYEVRSVVPWDGKWGIRLVGIHLRHIEAINGEAIHPVESFRKVEPHKFTNAITKELSEKTLTEEKKPQIERIQIKEKELV